MLSREEQRQRDEEIMRLADDGKGRNAIAEEIGGLTPQRVGQILHECGYVYDDALRRYVR